MHSEGERNLRCSRGKCLTFSPCRAWINTGPFLESEHRNSDLSSWKRSLISPKISRIPQLIISILSTFLFPLLLAQWILIRRLPWSMKFSTDSARESSRRIVLPHVPLRSTIRMSHALCGRSRLTRLRECHDREQCRSAAQRKFLFTGTRV